MEETILDEFEEIKSSGQSENEGADEEETESEDLAELEENPFQCLEQIERNRNFICCNAEGYAAFRASDRS